MRGRERWAYLPESEETDTGDLDDLLLKRNAREKRGRSQ
jgi:hypothetical protein